MVMENLMPAKSKKQRRMMAIAEHHPGMLYDRNKGVLKMSKKDLSDYASTKEKGLKGKKGKGKNPFFGNSLPFQLGDGGRWFGDSHPMGQTFCKKGK